MKNYKATSVSFSGEDREAIVKAAGLISPLLHGVPTTSATLRFLIQAAPYLMNAIESIDVSEDVEAAMTPEELLRMKWSMYQQKFAGKQAERI